MLLFESVIYSYNGRTFRFGPATAEPSGTLECHVCYWRGMVRHTSTGYEAVVEQKYTPYAQIAAPEPFATRPLALQWVAQQLINEQ